MNDSVKFAMKNSYPELSRLIHEVNECLQSRDLSDRTLYIVNLALEEMLTNILKHGYDDEKTHFITVRLHVSGSEIGIELEDDGCEFNPLAMPAPDVGTPLEDSEPGGLGILLVRRMTDSLEYTREDGKNLLRIKVRLG